MKKSWKHQIARMTGTNYKFNRKVLQLKSSWDEVSKLLNTSVQKKKK